jgi:rare lipoprotein A
MHLAPRWRSPLLHATLWLTLVVLAGCASGPPKSDGPEAKPPADLASVPDAEPRLEPIRTGGPNKSYEVLGRDYVPMTDDRPFSERGLASWYGRKFHGRRTASGEVYDMYAMTAAHPTLPIPSYVRVRNPANAREVVVRVNDRGPFHAGRVIDLSYTAALKLGLLKGVSPVELTRITFDDIRTGAWRKGAPAEAPSADRVNTAVALVKPPPEIAPIDDTPPPVTARPARGFWVQLGAFRQRDGADSFQRRVVGDLDWLAPMLAVFSDASVYRLQAGPYASRDEAQSAAQRVRDALQLVPVIVERR